MKKALTLIILITLFAGCTGESSTELTPVNKTVSCSKPYILYSGSCCLDLNDNSQCDYLEGGTPDTTTTTQTQTTENNPATPTTIIEDQCRNRLQDGDETGIDCGGSCKPCRTPCDVLINETGAKPAARTTKLCLSTREKTGYENTVYGLDDLDGIITVTAFTDNKTISAPLIEGEDMAIGNIVMRLIGTAKPNSVTYAQVYAWTIEGGIECTVNSDCGQTQYFGATCVENRRIIDQYISYRCINPGSILSKCVAQQKGETIKTCNEGEICLTGDNICLQQECANLIMDGDEDGVDCGGNCRPCHCFDKITNEGETGIDCGGNCRPCKQNELQLNDSNPPKINISLPQAKTYSNERIDLVFETNEKANCTYSINNSTYYIGERRNVTITAFPGINQLIVYCTDAAGNNASAKQQFTAALQKSSVCGENTVSADFREHFDEIIFYADDEAILGSPTKCEQQTFEYALTYLRDAGEHIRNTNETASMKDSNLSISTHAAITYDCRNTGKLLTEYASLTSTSNPRTSKLKMLLYFRETKSISAPGSYWRIYAYNATGDSVDAGKYLDIPYNPINSSCAKEANTLYQEIDLSPILTAMEGDTTRIRLGFYTNKINSELTISEIELAKEAKEITKPTTKK